MAHELNGTISWENFNALKKLMLIAEMGKLQGNEGEAKSDHDEIKWNADEVTIKIE